MSRPGKRRDPAAEPGELAQVGHQRLAGAGVLHLDCHVAPSCHRPLCTCPIRRGGRPAAIETSWSCQSAPRLVAIWSRTVWSASAARSPAAGQLFAIRRGERLGQRGLEHAQGLAELHRPALELAERAEELLGRPLLDLAQHVRRGAAQPPAEPIAVRPAYPSGSAASRAVRAAALRGRSRSGMYAILPDLPWGSVQWLDTRQRAGPRYRQVKGSTRQAARPSLTLPGRRFPPQCGGTTGVLGAIGPGPHSCA